MTTREELTAAAERQSKVIDNQLAGYSSWISRVYEWPWMTGGTKPPYYDPGKPDYEQDRQRLVEFAIEQLAKEPPAASPIAAIQAWKNNCSCTCAACESFRNAIAAPSPPPSASSARRENTTGADATIEVRIEAGKLVVVTTGGVPSVEPIIRKDSWKSRQPVND